MKQQATLIAGIIMALLAVATGAFGAHGLKEILLHTNRTDTFELAVRYQFYHAFALLVTGVLMHWYRLPAAKYASIFFIIGIILFSGSLYILSLTGKTILGAITPVGGLSFILGWLFLLWAVIKK